MLQVLTSPLASYFGKTILGVGSGIAISSGPSTAFHELGHALALKTLFSDVSPTIYVSWLGGHCATNGPCEKQTRIGKLFTRDTCLGIYAAAGPVFDLVNVAASSTLAHRIVKSHPSFSIALTMNAVLNLIRVKNYASDFEDPLGNDYQIMSKYFNIPRNRFIHIAKTICIFAGPFLLSNFFWALLCEKDGQCYVDKSPILWPWS